MLFVAFKVKWRSGLLAPSVKHAQGAPTRLSTVRMRHVGWVLAASLPRMRENLNIIHRGSVI